MIRLENVSKKFWNYLAVDNISLDIKDGECFSLLWRNWAWKSTTIKMIVGLLEASKWNIYFDGLSMKEESISIKSQMSYIPDMPYVYEKLRAIDFLYFVWVSYWMTKEKVKKKAEEYFEMFDLYDMLDKKIEEYSHGMKQKLVFTSALMHNPKYLILDEPMVWLDYQGAYIIKNIISTITKKIWATVIFTTHQIYVASEISDKVAIIHDWKLVQNLNDEMAIKNNLEQIFLSSTWEVNKDFENIIKS